MARDWIRFNSNFEVVGGYLVNAIFQHYSSDVELINLQSPVGDAYKKAGLSASHHRIK